MVVNLVCRRRFKGSEKAKGKSEKLEVLAASNIKKNLANLIISVWFVGLPKLIIFSLFTFAFYLFTSCPNPLYKFRNPV